MGTIFLSMDYAGIEDPDAGKGAVEPSRPEDNSKSNVAGFEEQLDHRFQNSLNKSSDSGMAESGQTEEFSMESQGRNEIRQDMQEIQRPADADANLAADEQNQDPGETQRRNQSDQEDDSLAA